jgi:hypothetical protein
MVARALLIGLDEVGAEDLTVLLEHESFSRTAHPDRARRILGDIPRKSVGLPGRDDLVKDRPDALEVLDRCVADSDGSPSGGTDSAC